MMPKKLRFYAVGTGLVPDIDAQDAGIRRYVGRKFGPMKGPDGEDRHGFAPTDKPQEVPFHHEYVAEAKAGHLRPADEETARACGLECSDGKPADAHPEIHDVASEGA